MKKLHLIFILLSGLCMTQAMADVQINKRMDRQVGDFDEDQAYGSKPDKSPDLPAASQNIQETFTPQIDYLNAPDFEIPANQLSPPEYPE